MSDIELIENIKLAFDLQKKGQYREAIAVLYKVLAIEPDNIEAIIQIAYLFYARHDVEIATEYYEKALQLENKNAQALEGLLTIYISTKKYKEALRIASKLCEISSDVNSFIQLLYILCLNEEYNLVIKTFETSQYKDTKSEYVYFYLGLSYFYLRDYDSAETYLHKALKLDDQHSESMYYLSKIYFDKGDFQRADDLLNSLLSVRQSAKAYNLKGLIQLHYNNNAKAINYFTFATKINNKISEYYYNLAVAYSLNGWLVEAENCYRKAIMLEPENMLYHYTLAYLYYETREFAKSQDELNYIRSAKSDYLDARVLEALIMLEDNQVLQAKAKLEALITEVPEYDFVFYALGKANRALELYDEAILNIKKAIELKPKSLDYKSELAEYLILKESYDEALQIADEIIEINKYFIHAYLLKAKILLLQDKYDDALPIVESAIRLDSNEDSAYFLKAQILLKKDMNNAAVDNIKTAITLSPNEIKYYRFLAEIYSAASNYRNALDYYREIFDNVVDNPELYICAAECAEKVEEIQQAKEFYLRAYRVAPTNPKIIIGYADFLVRQGKYKNALKFLYNIVKKENALPAQSMLIPKYDEVKQAFLRQASALDKLVYKAFKI